MEGFPEYAYTTAEKQPDPYETLMGLSEAVEGGDGYYPRACEWPKHATGRFDFASMMAGYLAAVNRLPIFIIDPAEMLGKETD